ncbi:MAG: flagellar basal body rod protein FlgB [Thermoflexaceae bacterium]|nr:flagellar basal body rod protein FlgB [Thermoflexaceae bacterium]
MFGSGAFDYVDVLNKAADASYYRNEILSNNIANVDTPGYKRKDLEFEKHLSSAIERAGDAKSTLSEKVHNVDLSEAKMVTYIDNTDLSYRIDDNNVDIATEQVELASNQLVYNGLVDSMTHEFSRIKSVLT